MQSVLTGAAQFAQLLKAYRKERGLSQQQLAAQLGVAQSYLSKLERDPGQLSLSRMLDLCAALDLEILIGDRTRTNNSAVEW